MKKFTSVERFADNGGFSHYELIDENGETIIQDIMEAKKAFSDLSIVMEEIDKRIGCTNKNMVSIKGRTSEAKLLRQKYESATTALVLLKMHIRDKLTYNQKQITL